MSAGTIIASVLLLCALCTAGLTLWFKHQQILQREAFQALAARRGWSLTISEQKLGRPAILRLTSRSGSGWHSESRLDASSQKGVRHFPTTVLLAEEPVWPEGCLVLTLDNSGHDNSDHDNSGPDRSDRASGSLPDGRSPGSLPAPLYMAVPPELQAQLRPFPSPAGLTVQATVDPVHRFDLDALAKVMENWNPHTQSSDALPVIQIGSDGFRLQVSHGMRRADEMESFIDFALAVIRVI